MNPILIAVIVLCAIGIVCALLLVLASKFMAVPVDEKFPAIRECLPGANCGACGFAGCDGYASALASGAETAVNKCPPGGNSVAAALAEVCGASFEETEKMVAYVKCIGTCDKTSKKAEYEGEKTCATAKLIFGGEGACQFGCLGYGDCAVACPEEAINIINGVAHINAARCIGCSVCVKTCPNHIIAMLPERATSHIACSNKDKGVVAMKKCTAGCIGCGLCAKKCEQGAITVTNFLASIDYEKCTDCGACAAACPKKCIK